MHQKILYSQYEMPYFFTPPPPLAAAGNRQANGFNLNSMVSPGVVLIIIVVAMIFFIAGLLHLLVRFLLRPSERDPDEFDNVTALEGQLQQLFHLHDSGVDQSLIDKLPVFSYKSIIGVKNPFDCAVCLCEFEGEDRLRLLPKCSHAFHMGCIETWLLAHSTCPLCRASLTCDSSSYSPMVIVLESGSGESFREVVDDSNSVQSAHHDDEECELWKEEVNKEKVVAIKLGKFKNCGEKNTFDGRRCFSMGSFEYVMDEDSSLKVCIRTHVKKQGSKKSNLPISLHHKPAMSECGGDSRRDFHGSIEAIGRSKRESFSVRGKKKDKDNSTEATIDIEPSFSSRFMGWTHK